MTPPIGLMRRSMINDIFCKLAVNFGKSTGSIFILLQMEPLHFEMSFMIPETLCGSPSFSVRAEWKFTASVSFSVQHQLDVVVLENVSARCLRPDVSVLLCCMFPFLSAHQEADCILTADETPWQKKTFLLVQLICWYWWWPGGRMYDVIYFNVWSDIICTAAKLLHGTSAFSHILTGCSELFHKLLSDWCFFA